jgi:ribonucleoside-diphosphate reductase beta chain
MKGGPKMAETLEELVVQGDPGTLADESQASKIQLLDPQQLYELWERQHWQTQELDFSADKEHWANFNDEERDYFTWGLSAFFIGEERVTTQFSGLVMAYEDESEEAFLTTQQVDEARHAQFFDRFYREVIGIDDPAWEDRLNRVREELNDAFVELFDNALVDANKALIADPKNPDLKVDFVTTYHMVIEGTLALTGQYMITDYLEKNDLLPGFVDGFKKVARDEHRHVAYGTWFLKEKCGTDKAMGERMRATLHRLLPTASGVLVPKGMDPNNWEMLGYTSEEINTFAFNALTRRLKAIGVPLMDPAAATNGASGNGANA